MIGALLIAVAVAVEPADDTPTVVVTGDRVEHAREAAVAAVEALGYRRKARRGDREVFVADSPWRPNVVLDGDGYLLTRRRAPHVTAANGERGAEATAGAWLACVIQPSACVHAGGIVVSRRKLVPEKEAIAAAVEPQLREWRAALADEAASASLNAWPARLDRLWSEGRDGDATYLTAADRRAAIAELWLTRTDTVWGDEARAAIERWIDAVVQASAEPFTAAEVAAVNERCACERVFAPTDAR